MNSRHVSGCNDGLSGQIDRVLSQMSLPLYSRNCSNHRIEMNKAFPLSIPVITCNEQENLKRCLASVATIAAEMIVVDSGSTDDTQAVA